MEDTTVYIDKGTYWVRLIGPKHVSLYDRSTRTIFSVPIIALEEVPMPGEDCEISVADWFEDFGIPFKEERIEWLTKAGDEEMVRIFKKQSAPFLTASGELRIGFDSPKKYHWWDGGQSIEKTLIELKASKEIIGKYVQKPSGHYLNR